ncbi:YceI family protein [Flagellimonas algicola]|uniref:YceI family protein n=2 Tax=Flagellimonas algicola TaxID=2583815 RepID=A0ABY2WLA7_9FLAO|nr:YceI family protein [Allomuricauda algicola]
MVQRMAKISLVLILFLWNYQGVAQDQFIDRNGVVIFEASEELFEEVKAINSTATAVYDAETNELASLTLVRAFEFKNSLMQEHFNESYAESDQFPKAIFRGALKNFDLVGLPSAGGEVQLEGTLDFHGKVKKIQTVVNAQLVNDVLSLLGNFTVSPADFDIEIPRIVRNQIAKEVQVKFDFKLKRK